jgi:hypothetical protein
MSEREVVLDEPVMDEQSEALRTAVERAERAEAELAKMKRGQGAKAAAPAAKSTEPPAEAHARREPELTGIDALRQDDMMAYLLDSLDAGKDIGHYGRLVFAMVARHFMSDEDVLAQLAKDPDFPEEQAVAMLRQVEGRDYNPPRRERIMEWQREQEFPILPRPEDPDCGNVYRTLTFPQKTYSHIGQYQEEKAEASS